MSTPDIVEDAFQRGRQIERERCAKITCPDCARGIPISSNGEHILETIQGHVAHSRACLARSILRGWDP